jgi:small ligand-binding sensory domain FIST
MLPDNDAEVNSLLTEFPSGLTLSGFYSYGELGPQGAAQTKNFAHNESLIFCAI